MGSPFRSALAKLDDSVQNLEQQLAHLHGSLEVADDQLWQALDGAHQSSAALRNLIRAEHPDASWTDRRSLELLIQQLEWEAQAKRDEERRAKIFDLAGELDAGTIKHRFESRVATLNSLRLQAIRELRIAGTLFEQEKELPGPPAGDWVHWACNLQEETDGQIFETLRKDFPALERFAGEMEESYWVPGQRDHEAAHTHSPASGAEQWIAQHAPSAVTGEPAESTSEGDRLQTEPSILASSLAPAMDYQAAHDIASTERLKSLVAEIPGAPIATTAQVLDKVGEHSNGNGAVGELHSSSTVKMWTVPSQPAAAMEPSEQPTTEETGKPLTETPGEDVLPTFGAVAAARKSPPAVWIAAGVIVVLGSIFAGTYYFSSGSGSKSSESVAHAASTPAEGVSGGQPASGTGSLPASGGVNAGIQPIEGAQHQILLNMESCRRSTAQNIECQGYVTNLGTQLSHVTLGGVDVVDGKGNSFNLNGSTEVNFSSGRSQNIAAGSRAKYTVKVPDKDRDARTLTVYVDVNNPHGLEFTFRNVPIAE